MAKGHAFDVRILDRNLDKGVITREQYDEFLAQLDDAEANSINIQAEFVEGVFERAAASRKAARAAAPIAARDDYDDDLAADEEE